VPVGCTEGKTALEGIPDHEGALAQALTLDQQLGQFVGSAVATACRRRDLDAFPTKTGLRFHFN
jgi:hypothetical protein